jgi:histone deacetylase 1/2
VAGSASDDSAASPEQAPSPTPSPDDPPQRPPPTRVQTRLQQGIRQPKKYTDGTVRYGLFSSTGEPSTHSEALDTPQWRQAMEEEYHALMENKTWHLVPPSKNQNLIDCKWVYKVK